MYQKDALLNKKFLPKVSQRFDVITVPKVEVKSGENIVLCWEGQKTLNFDVIIRQNDQDTTLASLSGVDNKMTYSLPLPNSNAEIYLKISYKHAPEKLVYTEPIRFYKKD